MARIHTYIDFTMEQREQAYKDRTYLTGKYNTKWAMTLRAFNDLYPYIKNTIVEKMPEGWGAICNDVGGMELSVHKTGRIQSFVRNTDKGDKISFLAGSIISGGLGFAFLAFEEQNMFLVPERYHFTYTDEHQGVRGLTSSSLDNSSKFPKYIDP